MKKLTKESEDRLLGAIEKTAVLVNGGMHPNDAIVKAAVADGIPPGHVNLMVQAYNTGRTTRQRQEGSSPLEKAAEFPLADASEVLSKMYPDKVKTAAQIQYDNAISLEYAVSPTGLLQRRHRKEMQKVARDIDWSRWSRGEYADEDGNVHEMTVHATDPGPLPSDPAVAMKRAYYEADRMQKEVGEARRKQAAAFDKMANTFGEITEYFRRPDASPIPVVQEQAMLLHGGKGRQLIDEVVKVTPSLMKLSKHKKAQVSNYLLEPADGEIYGLISQFLDETDDYKKCKRAHDELLTKHSRRTEEVLRPFVDRPISVLTELGYSTEKSAGGVMPTVIGASAIKNLFTGGGPDAGKSQTNKALSELTDPAHEQELRNIRAQAMLQDIMMNDPVIGGYDPTETLSAYNDIISMSPRNADQRMFVQPLLRKRLEQGSLDPFEVDQMLGMEERQKKINTNRGDGDGSVLS